MLPTFGPIHGEVTFVSRRAVVIAAILTITIEGAALLAFIASSRSEAVPAGKVMSLLLGGVAVAVLIWRRLPLSTSRDAITYAMLVGFATPVLLLSLTLAGFQGLAKDLDLLSVEYAQTGSLIVLSSVLCHWLATLVIGSVRRTTRCC